MISRRESILLASLALFALYLTYYLVFMDPLLAERSSLRRTRTDLEQRISYLESWQTRESSLAADVRELLSRKAALASAAITEALVLIEDFATVSGVVVDNLNIEDAFTPSGGALFATFSGSYEQVYKFVSELESRTATFDLDHVWITGSSDSLYVELSAHVFSGRVPAAERLSGVAGQSPFGVR